MMGDTVCYKRDREAHENDVSMQSVREQPVVMVRALKYFEAVMRTDTDITCEHGLDGGGIEG